MKKLLIPIYIILFGACQKEPIKKSCLGCGGISYTTRQFTFKGQLVEDCTGKPAVNKKLQGFLLDQIDPPVLETITVGTDGKFAFTYTIKQASNIPVMPSTTPSFLIQVLDDSLQFIIPGTIEFSNLTLNLNDPINCKINTVIDPDSRLFTTADTIIGYYVPRVRLSPLTDYPSFLFKKAGPFSNGTIGTMNGRFKVINIDEKGQPFVKLAWNINSSSSSVDTARVTKIPCILRQDSVILKLKR